MSDHPTRRLVSDWEWIEYEPEPFADEADLAGLPSFAWHRVTEQLVNDEWVRVTQWHFGIDPPDQIDDPRPDWAWDSPELFHVDDEQPILRLIDGERDIGRDGEWEDGS